MKKSTLKTRSFWTLTTAYVAVAAGFAINKTPEVIAQTPGQAQSSEVQQLLQTKQCSGCNLSGANLQNADLEEANLQNANLQNADLDKANLQQASLQRADLEDANLQQVDFEDTIMPDGTIRNN